VIRLYMRRQPGALSILKEGIKTSKSASSIGRAGRESAGGAARRDYGQRNGGLNEHRVHWRTRMQLGWSRWCFPHSAPYEKLRPPIGREITAKAFEETARVSKSRRRACPASSGAAAQARGELFRMLDWVSLLKTRFERIDGVVRQGLDTRQCLRIVRLAVCRARPSRAKRASAPHCNTKRISKGFVEGARR